MNPAAFMLRGLRHRWRLHAASAAGVALAGMVLTGALTLGDSVRFSLERRQLLRLGRIEQAMAPSGRHFRAALAAEIGADAGADTAAVLIHPGVVSLTTGERRLNQANVIGIDARFLALAEQPESAGLTPQTGEALVNRQAAHRLGVQVGDEIVVRLGGQGPLPLDSPFVASDASSKPLRLRIKGILPSEALGDFDLRIRQGVPGNLLVNREELAAALGLADLANAVMEGENRNQKYEIRNTKYEIRNKKYQTINSKSKILNTKSKILNPKSEICDLRSEIRDPRSTVHHPRSTVPDLSSALRRHWQLADAGLSVALLADGGGCEVRSAQVFLGDREAEGVRQAYPSARGVFGYLANEFRAGERRTPYSFAVGIDGDPVTADLAADEIVINTWLAEDLGIGPGDRLAMRYFVVGDRRELREEEAEFRVRAVVPIAGAAADPGLAPAFPGLADAANCRDWQAGPEIDLGRIRDRDEAYWQAHGPTPKAFLPLATAQRLWGNRYGRLTALRVAGEDDPSAVAAAIRRCLSPEAVGLAFRPVRAEALRAARSGVDFGQLFLGLSMFLVASALLLAALLFGFGIESRGEEVGLLRALGFTRRETGTLLLLEGALSALPGAILGGAAGLAYSLLLIHGLRGAWQGAVGETELLAKFAPGTVALGIVLAWGAAIVGMAAVLLRQLRHQPAELQAGLGITASPGRGPRRHRLAMLAAIGMLAGIAVLVITLPPNRGREVAGGYFLAGTLLLTAMLLLVREAASTSPGAVKLGIGSGANPDRICLPWRNARRRTGRSLAVMALAAVGIFLVVAVAANRRSPAAEVNQRQGGTGGFALYGETALPWVDDLNGARQRARLGLDAADDRVRFVQIKAHDGDDASCLNLNRVAEPRILGVDPEDFRTRGAFRFASVGPEVDPADPWQALAQPSPDGAIPAFADQSVIQWGLGKRLGDILEYPDGHGGILRLRLAGALEDSVFQGSVLISQAAFARHFPSLDGFRVMLVDLPADLEVATFASGLARLLRDAGLETIPASERLATFQAVENTYLSVFLLLGGLGVLLGAAGVGIVLLRNALERQGELALMRAVGFARGELSRQLLGEHAGLLVGGLALGLSAGALAVLPAIATAPERIPWAWILGLAIAILLHGLAWALFAARQAIRALPARALCGEE